MIIIITWIHRFSLLTPLSPSVGFNSWLNVYLLKSLLCEHVVGLSFCVGFHIARKERCTHKKKCFVLTVRDINERTSSISYDTTNIEIRIPCNRRKKKYNRENAGLRTMNDDGNWTKWKIERKWRICELNVNARESPFKINIDCVEHDKNSQTHDDDDNNKTK